MDELSVVTTTASVPCSGTAVAAAAAWCWKHVTDWILNVTAATTSPTGGSVQQQKWLRWFYRRQILVSDIVQNK